MRPFVRSAFALACAAASRPRAQAQQTTTLKMQATWPASLTLYENFTLLRRARRQALRRHAQDRRDAGGPGRAGVRGARRHAQEGDRRRALLVGLLGRQEQGRDPVHRRPGRHLRHGHDRLPSAGCTTAAASSSGGVLPEGAQAQRALVPDPAVGSAGVRLVQAADQEPRRLQGHEVPPDRHGRGGVAAHGHDRRSTCPAARSSRRRSAA